MFELQELRKRIEEQDYQGALKIVDELEEMSLEDKLNKIESYMVILLMHLIKQEAEQRTTSWNRSISNSVKGINKTNKRSKSGGYYAKPEAIETMFEETFDDAMEEAAYEAFEGKLSIDELAAKLDRQQIINKAISLCNAKLGV
jgi:uncharacterized protein YqgV (UPF0045/DUF77 family)